MLSKCLILKKVFGLEQGFITPDADYGELNTSGIASLSASFELGNSNLTSGFVLFYSVSQPLEIESAVVNKKN